MQVTELIDATNRFTIFDFRTTQDEPILPFVIDREVRKSRGIFDQIEKFQIEDIKNCHWKLSRLTVKKFFATNNGIIVVVVDGTLDEIKELLSD